MIGREILLAHGGGGRLSRDLIEEEIVSRFGDGPLDGLPDAATICLHSNELVLSTDSFVVQPLFFPGGNIGDLAVYGTVNDIAVCGGRPLYLSLALILEEGLEISVFRQVLDSVKRAADDCSVVVVTGDTKVVRRGQCDGMYINTTGIGELVAGFLLRPSRVVPGDCVVASGTLGDHGMAVMSVREEIHFANGPRSDTGPVHRLMLSLADIAAEIKVMRDPTRGGVAAVLNELVSGQDIGISLSESSLPFSANVRAAAELLGFDLLHVACEGRVIAVCSASVKDEVLRRWRSFPEGENAAVIGQVTGDKGRVVMETLIGGKRFVDVPEGELLPRIC